MSLSSFVVSRNWASSRLRLLLTLFGIALGVAIVVAIYVMDHNTIQSRLLAQQPQRGRVDLELVALPSAAPADALARQVAALPAVEAVAVWREARGEVRHGATAVDVAVFGLGPLPAGPFAHYAVAAGRDLQEADDAAATPGVLLGAEAARGLGIAVGATVVLAEPPGAVRTECRDGVLVALPPATDRPPAAVEVQVVGLLDGTRLGARNFGQVVVCGVQLARRLQPRGQEVFHVLRRDGADLDRLSRDLREQFTVMDLRGALIGEGADERAFRNGLKVLGGLALLLGMYVVFQTLSHALVARVKQLGLLRCLGAGSGAITRIFLWDALLLGALGALLGVVMGLGLAWLLRHYEVSSLGLHKAWSTFEIPWYPVGWTYALGVLFTLAGAMFPLVRARQVPALQILQSRGLAAGKDDGIDLLRGINLWMFALLVFALPLAYLAMTPLAAEEGKETLVVLLQLVGMLALFGTVLLLAPWIVAWFGRALLWPLRFVLPMPAWLCAKVVARQSGRIAASVCGLAAVLLALLGLKSVTASLRAEVDQFAAEALHGRIYLRSAPASAAEVEALARLPGVLRVDACVGEARGNGYFLRGLAVESVAGDGGALDGQPELVRRYADERVRTAVISRRLARSQGLRAGSVLTLPDRNGVPVAYQVLAISDRSGFDMDERAFAVTAPHWLRRDFCSGERSVEFAALHLRLGVDPEALAGPIREALPSLLKQKSGAWIHGFLGRDVDRDFVLFDLLLLLMLVLAGTGLLNGMTIAALGRIRELGVLRALGMARADLRWSFVLEGALVAALASALAIGLALPMAVVLVRGMNQVAALDAPVTLPTAWLGIAAAAALLTGVLAALVPAWRASRQSPGESVRYE